MPAPPAPPTRVAVLCNERSPESVAIAEYYASKRRLPKERVLRFACPPDEKVPRAVCEREILAPVRFLLQKRGLWSETDFLVTTRGVPLLLAEPPHLSVDALLMLLPQTTPLPSPAANPYFLKSIPFRRSRAEFFLCTRLDAYTVEQAKALVDNSVAARPQKGLFLFDQDPNRERPGYFVRNDEMGRAAASLREQGFRVRLDPFRFFAEEKRPLMGYYSWGSNDRFYNAAAYRALRFHPGALAETVVSTSARTFRRTRGGQSLIADLIEGGVTGAKGYVSEPYVFAMANPEILFGRYTDGFTLAESFYAASQVLNWKDVVIGDPLCAPYAQKPVPVI